MKQTLNRRNEKVFRLEVRTDFSEFKTAFEVPEKVFSKILRNETTAELLTHIQSRMIAEGFKQIEKELRHRIGIELSDEFEKLLRAMPEPLPEEPVVESAVRCSRQLTTEQMEAMRQKLLKDLETLYD